MSPTPAVLSRGLHCSISELAAGPPARMISGQGEQKQKNTRDQDVARPAVPPQVSFSSAGFGVGRRRRPRAFAFGNKPGTGARGISVASPGSKVNSSGVPPRHAWSTRYPQKAARPIRHTGPSPSFSAHDKVESEPPKQALHLDAKPTRYSHGVVWKKKKVQRRASTKFHRRVRCTGHGRRPAPRSRSPPRG